MMDTPEKTEEPKVSIPTNVETMGSQNGQTTNEVFLSKDGFKLFPQPVQGDDRDPLNWSFFQKHIILTVIMAL